MRHCRSRTARLLGSIAALALVAAGLSACATSELPASISGVAYSDADWRREAETWGNRYRTNPRDATAAVNYARALRAIGQRPQAEAVLEQASIQAPKNTALLGAYGRALADVGKYQQALDVLSKAHTPDEPDARILSAQGAILDQMGRHDEAQRYYSSALKISPDDASVLSNLGLSYALAKDLPNAERTLRRAAERSNVDARVRQNLALVVGLQGRFPEAEAIARADLPPDEAAANVAYLKQMLAEHKERKKPARPPPRAHVASTAAD